MDNKEIAKLFSDEKYIEALNILENEYKLNKNDININSYLYFIYEILNLIDKKKEQYTILEKKYNGNKDEIYYQLATTCENISSRTDSYHCNNDIFRFLNLAIKENPNNIDSLFLLGKLKVSYENVKEGFTFINKAIKLNHKFLEKKIKFLSVIYIKLKSKKELIFILNEFNTIDKKMMNNECYLKLMELNITLKKYNNARKIIKYFKTKKSNKYELQRINKSCLDFYISIKNYKNAIKYVNKIDLWDKAEFFYNFKKYKESAEVFKNYLSKESKRSSDSNIMNKIADSYLKDNEYELALEFIEKAISNNTDKNFFILDYLNSFIIKGQIFLKQKKFNKSIEIFEQAYNLVRSHIDNAENKSKEKILKDKLEEILFNLALVNEKAHIYRFIKNKKNFEIPSSLNDINEYENIINNIELNFYFRTQNKKNFDRFVNELISLNYKKEKKILKLEKEIKSKEEFYKNSCYHLIIKTSKIMLKIFPDNEKILLKIALNLQNIKENNKALLIYKKLIKLNPSNSSYNNNVAVIYQEKNNYKKAEKYFLDSIKDQDYDSTIYNNIFNFYNEHLLKINENDKWEIEKIKNKINETFDYLVKNEIFQSSKITHRTYNNLVSLRNLTIYKYKSFSINILDSFTNNYLYFSSLNELNDPLDIPLLEMSKHDIFKNLNINIEDIKIYCTSQSNNNTLMWSHYADSHKGICIGYKITSLPQSIGWNLIEYVDHNLNFERMTKNKGLIHAGIFNKQKYWEYEKEIRFIKYKKNDKKIYYKYPIHPDEKNFYIEGFIDNIIIGYKFADDNLKTLIPIINNLNKYRINSGINRIKLYKTKLEKNKPFNLKIESISY